MLGLEGPPNFSEGWSELRGDDLERLAALADRQAKRLCDAADGIGAELGEERVAPSYRPGRPRVDYLFDDGVEAAFERLREKFRRPEHGSTE